MLIRYVYTGNYGDHFITLYANQSLINSAEYRDKVSFNYNLLPDSHPQFQ